MAYYLGDILEFILDFFLNIVCFQVGAIAIRIITLGNHHPSLKKSKNPWGVVIVGFGVLVVVALTLLSIFPR